jgi:hypothetical protein
MFTVLIQSTKIVCEVPLPLGIGRLNILHFFLGSCLLKENAKRFRIFQGSLTILSDYLGLQGNTLLHVSNMSCHLFYLLVLSSTL